MVTLPKHSVIVCTGGPSGQFNRTFWLKLPSNYNTIYFRNITELSSVRCDGIELLSCFSFWLRSEVLQALSALVAKTLEKENDI